MWQTSQAADVLYNNNSNLYSAGIRHVVALMALLYDYSLLKRTL